MTELDGRVGCRMDAAPQPVPSTDLWWMCGERGHHKAVNDGHIQRHRSPPVNKVLTGHAGASATLWWSVQLNVLGGTWKGQAFLAAIALDL